MFHQGYALKRHIEKNRIPLEEIVSLTGINRQGVYLQYGKEELDPEIIKSLKSKYKIPGVTEPTAALPPTGYRNLG